MLEVRFRPNNPCRRSAEIRRGAAAYLQRQAAELGHACRPAPRPLLNSCGGPVIERIAASGIGVDATPERA